MKRKISIEEIEQEDIDMDTLLRCYEYIKRAEAETEKPVISERTILKIVVMVAVLVFAITIILISYLLEDSLILFFSIIISVILILICACFVSGD